MKKSIKALSLLLVAALLVLAMPALAAQDETPAAPKLRQLSAAVKMYSEADASSSALYTASKNEVVLAYETEGKYTRVQTGKLTGYVQSSRLKAVNSSANITGIVSLKANATITGGAEATNAKTGQAAKGDVGSALMSIGNFTAVRVPGGTGFVPANALTVYSSSSKASGYLLYTKKVDVKTGVTKTEKRLTRANKGELIEALHTNESSAIVRRGSTVGVVALSGSAFYNGASASSGNMALKKDANIYSGPGSSYTKLGNAAKNEIVEKLGVSGKYTLVRKGGVIGLVETKSLSAASQNATPQTTPKPGTYAAITSEYVLTAVDGVPQHASASLSSSFTLVPLNTKYKYIETTADGQWVKVESGGKTYYLPRAYVREYKEPLPVIKTAYVAAKGNIYAYVTQSTFANGTIVPDGTLLEYVSMSADGEWVKINVLGLTYYVQRKDVEPTDKTPGTVELPDSKPSPTPTSAPSAGTGEYNKLALEFLDVMNGHRRDNGVAPLTINDRLMKAAAVRANEITVLFEHKRPDGSAFNTVDPSVVMGENILAGTKSVLPASAGQAFMDSTTGHRENALRSSFKTHGAGVVVINGAYYWVHLFGY
ncbi:MAG: CAP domain-containing protein [Clostridiales bacterium]|jgi:uncharacterized protein YkwD|nr:CAP domain-containing protein [Clostridiales bacterium]